MRFHTGWNGVRVIQNRNVNLKAKMIDLCNIKLKTRKYQIIDLGIIPVLPTQQRIIPVLTSDYTSLKINTNNNTREIPVSPNNTT